MADLVLTVIFQQASDFLAQEGHLARGAFFLPSPEPAPEPLVPEPDHQSSFRAPQFGLGD